MSDLIIIGSGPGGYRTAEYAARKGLSVTIFEEKEAGGTCLNCGCIPTKALCHEAEVADMLKEAGVTNIDYSAIKARKEQVIAQLRGGVETLLGGNNISFVRGHATLEDAQTVRANGETYTAKNIIIATGSHAKRLPIEGIDQENVMTSTELLDINEVPRRLCIVGAGVIGMEMASVFNSIGSEVTVIEFLKECLPMLDSHAEWSEKDQWQHGVLRAERQRGTGGSRCHSHRHWKRCERGWPRTGERWRSLLTQRNRCQ